MRFTFHLALGLCLLFQLASGVAYGLTVSELTALYQNGQVFLTWENPTDTNLQYNIYRSESPITTSSQLTTSSYLGYVRDNSAQNLRKSELNMQGLDYYYVITTNQSPLASDRGLYVATCSSSGIYYYAVTVTTLDNNQESSSINVGSNTLVTGVLETVAMPQPVLQLLTNQSNGDLSSEYVIWGDNQELPHWRALNNLGSYGYNFTVQTRGISFDQPLYVDFQDANPFKKADASLCPNGNILQMDDRLPNGQGTYWIGYNDSYNMYVNNESNPIVTSGTIHTYSQTMTQAIIRWTKRQPGIDSTRIYMTGQSHNGFGCLLTAMNMPTEIACIFNVAGPILYKTFAGDSREYQLCKATSNLSTDVYYPGTTTPMLIWAFTNMRTYYRINTQGIPVAQSINGKNDATVGWVQKFHWYDTLNAYRQGGTWFWDQRTHGGNNAQFLDSETTPDYLRYYSNRSYPAFSYCSINQDPGTGIATDGDDYGAINGYLDWDDASVSDQLCSYSIKCFVKDFYVGGVLDALQYDSCFTDITLRRTQKFHPESGQTINWSNYGTNNQLLQSGSFVYDGGLITLSGIKIKKSNSTITFTIENCGVGTEVSTQGVSFNNNLNVFPNPISDAATISFSVDQAQKVSLKIFDVTGRLLTILASETMNAGNHQLQWNARGENGTPFNTGIYFLKMETPNHIETIQLSVIK